MEKSNNSLYDETTPIRGGESRFAPISRKWEEVKSNKGTLLRRIRAFGISALSGTLALMMMSFSAVEVFAADAPPVEEATPTAAIEMENTEAVQAPNAQRKVLVLDAGHGGEDPGALDASGTILEADIAQWMLNRLLVMFEENSDELEVITTHEAGQNPSVNERAAVAKENNADLFVSLHLNAAGPDSRGFQVFPTPPGRTAYAESMKAAETLLGHVVETGIPTIGSGIYYCFYRSSKRNGSYKEFYDAMVVGDNIPSASTFGVLEYSEVPSMLVEMWFITNEHDMAAFNTEAGMQAMAQKLYRGMCEYLGVEAKV